MEKFIEDEKKEKKSCFFKGLCPNLISRHQLSRQAKKKALDVKKSLEGGDFPTISYRRPLPGAGSAALQGYEAFESRNQALEKIMEWLRCDDVKMNGVCGMGGVGKTTLVKQVANQAYQEKLFSTEIYIDVSWLQGKDEATRAVELKQRLRPKDKEVEQKDKEVEEAESKDKEVEKEKELKKMKILIILDDIWKEINLEEVGIPFNDQTKCKVVLASRNGPIAQRHVHAKMFSNSTFARKRSLAFIQEDSG